MRIKRALALWTSALLASSMMLAVAFTSHAGAQVGAVPRPDHVVIVIEENHSDTGIIGNSDAPYISSLAASNANFTQSYAITHPSEPNYLALFSGSTQGLTDDSCPHSYTTGSLGDELLAANLGFVGYSQGLPSTGYTGCGSGNYARKHNPWVNFPSIPASSNQPFTAFPTDYSTLPAVSVVVPDLQNDMHDGTVAQGDAWLQNNMSGYIAWAKQHNSVFILTFDEDDSANGNLIPTIMAGQRVAAGNYNETINHYSVLRTIEDAYGLAPLGSSQSAAPILDVWTPGSGNQAPVASFTVTPTGASVAVDASASTDDGSIASYAWDFGDGKTGTGRTSSHSYAAGGTYSVRLTVTDNLGATASTTRSVTVTGPAGAAFASDGFTRSITNGWGSADVGGAWTTVGSASLFSVGSGSGAVHLGTAGVQGSAFLGSVTSSDTDLTLSVAVDKIPIGGPVYLTVTGRRVSAGNEYDVRMLLNADRSVNLWLTRQIGGVEATLTPEARVTGLTFAAGSVINVRLQVVGVGPTAVRARAWAAGSAEPTAWAASATDTTSGLQVKGGIGVLWYLSSKATNAPLAASISNLNAKPTAAPPNPPPVASFTATPTGASVAVDASAPRPTTGRSRATRGTSATEPRAPARRHRTPTG